VITTNWVEMRASFCPTNSTKSDSFTETESMSHFDSIKHHFTQVLFVEFCFHNLPVNWNENSTTSRCLGKKQNPRRLRWVTKSQL
jgi:hypothetical protein